MSQLVSHHRGKKQQGGDRAHRPVDSCRPAGMGRREVVAGQGPSHQDENDEPGIVKLEFNAEEASNS